MNMVDGNMLLYFKFGQTTERCSKEKKTAKTRAKEAKILSSKR